MWPLPPPPRGRRGRAGCSHRDPVTPRGRQASSGLREAGGPGSSFSSAPSGLLLTRGINQTTLLTFLGIKPPENLLDSLWAPPRGSDAAEPGRGPSKAGLGSRTALGPTHPPSPSCGTLDRPSPSLCPHRTAEMGPPCRSSGTQGGRCQAPGKLSCPGASSASGPHDPVARLRAPWTPFVIPGWRGGRCFGAQGTHECLRFLLFPVGTAVVKSL